MSTAPQNNQKQTKFLKNRGITLLLVVVILSALLSISIGIFNVIFGEILVSGEIADSFRAFYSSDRSMERFLYLDRVKLGSSGGLPDGYEENTTAVESAEGCYIAKIDKGINTNPSCPAGFTISISTVGQYRCGPGALRVVQRKLLACY